MTIEEAIDNLLYFLRLQKHASSYTVRNYAHYLNRFRNFVAKLSPPLFSISDVKQSDIVNYKIFLNHYLDNKGFHLSEKTKAYHLIALRRLFRYLSSRGYNVVDHKSITLPEIEKKRPEIVDIYYIKKLLMQPDTSKTTGLRDRVILELFIGAGLTVSELTRLNKTDFDSQLGTMNVLGRRMSKRTLTLPDQVVRLIRQYLKKRRDYYPPMFLRYAGKKEDPAHAARELRISTRSVQRLVKKYQKASGIPQKITPKSLRHTFAVYQLEQGYKKNKLQVLLGQKSKHATKIYAEIAGLSS